jgi:hypothetical protein
MQQNYDQVAVTTADNNEPKNLNSFCDKPFYVSTHIYADMYWVCISMYIYKKHLGIRLCAYVHVYLDNL